MYRSKCRTYSIIFLDRVGLKLLRLTCWVEKRRKYRRKHGLEFKIRVLFNFSVKGIAFRDIACANGQEAAMPREKQSLGQ